MSDTARGEIGKVSVEEIALFRKLTRRLFRALEDGATVKNVPASEPATWWLDAIGPDTITQGEVVQIIEALDRLTPEGAQGDGETNYCPHAAPFNYCAECVVTPCPIGLGGKK